MKLEEPVRLSPEGAEVDLATGRFVWPDGTSGRLTALERVTLLVLLANRGEVVSRETLFAAAHAGVTPDPSGLRAVDQAVSRLRRRVAPGGGIAAVRGKGYRLEPLGRSDGSDRLDGADGAGRLGGADRLDGAHRTMEGEGERPRREEARLIGRQTELMLVESELALGRRPVRHVELVGAGGIGKTTLAREVFSRALARGEAAVWVGLEGAQTLLEVASRTARAMGLEVESHVELGELVQGIAARLGARLRTLVVFDDVDQAAGVWPELGRVVSWEATRVLSTCRQTHAAEWLTERGVKTIAVGPLPDADALRLLEQRVGAKAGEDARLPELVARIGGWPLALELALVAPNEASGLDALTPALEAMWRVLGERERLALKLVALSRGTLVAHSDLVDAQALAAIQRGGWLGPRRGEGLEVHALVREFVLTQTDATDRARFVEHLAGRVRRILDAPVSMDSRAMAELARLVPSLSLALAMEGPGHEVILAGLARHHHLQGPRERALEVAELLRVRLHAAPTFELHAARALLLLGARAEDAGRADAKAALGLAAVAERGEALALVARTHRDEPEVAVGALKEAIALATTPLDRARAESVLAALLAREERFDEACAPMMRAVDALERAAVETRFAEENFLAFILCECGMVGQARRMWERAEAAFLAHAKRPVRPGFMAVRALMSTGEGELARALHELDYVIAKGAEVGRPALTAQALVWRAVVLLLDGQVEQARAWVRETRGSVGGEALEPPDRALWATLEGVFAEAPEPWWAAARAAIGERFPSTRYLVARVSGEAWDGGAPVGVRARLAERLAAVCKAARAASGVGGPRR